MRRHDEARAEQRHIEALAVERHQHRSDRDPRANPLEHRSLLAQRADEDLLQDEGRALPPREAHEEGDGPRSAGKTGGLGVEKERGRRVATRQRGVEREQGQELGAGVATACHRRVPRPVRGREALHADVQGPEGRLARDERELARVDRRQRQRPGGAALEGCLHLRAQVVEEGGAAWAPKSVWARRARGAPGPRPGRPGGRACCEGTRGGTVLPLTVHRFSGMQKRRSPSGRPKGGRRLAALPGFPAPGPPRPPRSRGAHQSASRSTFSPRTAQDSYAAPTSRVPAVSSAVAMKSATRAVAVAFPTRRPTRRTTSSRDRALPVAARSARRRAARRARRPSRSSRCRRDPRGLAGRRAPTEAAWHLAHEVRPEGRPPSSSPRAPAGSARSRSRAPPPASALRPRTWGTRGERARGRRPSCRARPTPASGRRRAARPKPPASDSTRPKTTSPAPGDGDDEDRRVDRKAPVERHHDKLGALADEVERRCVPHREGAAEEHDVDRHALERRAMPRRIDPNAVKLASPKALAGKAKPPPARRKPRRESRRIRADDAHRERRVPHRLRTEQKCGRPADHRVANSSFAVHPAAGRGQVVEVERVADRAARTALGGHERAPLARQRRDATGPDEDDVAQRRGALGGDEPVARRLLQRGLDRRSHEPSGGGAIA